MSWSYERIYVVECVDHNYFYVGTTLREMFKREEEHAAGYGSRWTHRHGFRRVMFCQLVPTGTSTILENELTKYLMARFGWGFVRGGDYVFVRCRSRLWLPRAFRDLGPEDRSRHVLELHAGSVSKFPTELRRLIDGFEMSRRFQHADHLNTDPLPEPVVGGVPEQIHHVLPGHSVPVPLRAE